MEKKYYPQTSVINLKNVNKTEKKLSDILYVKIIIIFSPIFVKYKYLLKFYLRSGNRLSIKQNSSSSSTSAAE